MSARKFDLIAFDWDGTLFDSTAAISRSIQLAVADVPLAVDQRAAQTQAGEWGTQIVRNSSECARTLADQAPLALDVARAVAWEIGGELVEIPD